MGDRKQMPPLRLVLSLLASVTTSVAGLLVVRWLAPAGWLHANNEVAGNYLQTIGTIYAVLLAFVVFVVWQQHNDVRAAVQSEANEVSDLHRLIQSFPEPIRAQVNNCLYAYRAAVVEDEWTTLSVGRPSERAGPREWNCERTARLERRDSKLRKRTGVREESRIEHYSLHPQQPH